MATLTINPTNWGRIIAKGEATGRGITYDTVREDDAYVLTTNYKHSTNDNEDIKYNRETNARSQGIWEFTRTYCHWDTSAIPAGSTINSVEFTVTGSSSPASGFDSRFISSSAFGGDGGSSLVSTDYFDSLDYSTVYVEQGNQSAWPDGAAKNYTLNLNTTTAYNQILGGTFIIAIVHRNDYNDSDTPDLLNPSRAGINWSDSVGIRLYINYTAPAPTGTRLSIPSGRLTLSSGKFTI